MMLHPRPIFSFALPIRASRTVPSLQCRRAIHSSTLFPPPHAHKQPRSSFFTPRTAPRLTHRHASSATTALKPQPTSSPSRCSSFPAKSPSSTILVPLVRAKLNPPEDTYAPELTIPSKKPGQNSFKYLFQCGKLYIAFYKKGIQNVRSTAKLAKGLRAKAASHDRQHAANSEKAGRKARNLGVLTRAEWQVVRRSKVDMLRLPGFAVLVLIFGEWMPLIALYITGLIPEACRIPRQVERTLRKLEHRRRERERRLALDAARLVSRDRRPGSTGSGIVRAAGVGPDDVEKMDLYTLLSLSTKLDAHSAVWDWTFMTPPKWFLRWAVRTKLEYLGRDDGLIERDGGVQALGEREVQRACVERGIAVVGKNEEHMRRALAEWFRR